MFYREQLTQANTCTGANGLTMKYRQMYGKYTKSLSKILTFSSNIRNIRNEISPSEPNQHVKQGEVNTLFHEIALSNQWLVF